MSMTMWFLMRGISKARPCTRRCRGPDSDRDKIPYFDAFLNVVSDEKSPYVVEKLSETVASPSWYAVRVHLAANRNTSGRGRAV